MEEKQRKKTSKKKEDNEDKKTGNDGDKDEGIIDVEAGEWECNNKAK